MPVIKPVRGIRLNKSRPFARGLVGLWPFNEGTGKIVSGSSGNVHAGSLIGDTHWVAGKFGSCLSFDKSNPDYVEIGDKDIFDGMPAITVAVWYNSIYQDSGEMSLASKMGAAAAAANWNLALSFVGSNIYRLRFTAYETDSSFKAISAGNTTHDGQWHFGVGVSDGSYLRLYEDGVEIATPVARSGDLQSSNSRVRIGLTDNDLNPYNGLIDNVMVWNRALSPFDIARLYQKPFCMFEVAASPKVAVVVAPGIVEIAGAITAASILTDTAALRRARGIAGGVAAQSFLAGSIKVSKKISGAISATSSLSGSLSLVGEVSRSRGSGFKPIEGAERLRGLRRSAFY